MRKISTFLLLLMLFTVGFSLASSINAHADLSTTVNDIKNSGGAGLDSDNAIKGKMTGTTKDIVDIVSVGVLCVLMITGIVNAIKFANIGDDAQGKSKLKKILIGEAAGIFFIANYLGLVQALIKGVSGIFK